jgi:hypothetical protein
VAAPPCTSARFANTPGESEHFLALRELRSNHLSPPIPDDPFYLPYLPNTSLDSPKPHAPEPLWELRKNHHTYSCELKFRNEWGILRDDELIMGRRFDTRAQAVQWAEEEPKFREASSVVTSEPSSTRPYAGC